MRQLLMLPLLMPLLWGAPAAAATDCVSPPELIDSGPLPGVAAGITSGTLRVLAVGSASILGLGTSSPAAAWPVRLEAELLARLPGKAVTVAVMGGRGLTATDQLALIRDAIRQVQPNVVIWQAAATEAMRGFEVAELADALARGLTRLKARPFLDAVLVDLQFSRFLRANADIEPYRETLRVASAAHGAPLFRRYDLMQSWADAGSVDVERASRATRTQEVDRLNACLAQAFASFLLDGARDAGAIIEGASPP
ncbi:SGNH/GDSL hydrolase family protein [Humitalea sp. 24SJ18S-53]|uniref:SGNH/GDSL hydrolase family protein n=1 Tax=Humitalea sp. 24SJ18S-53 TaxID=3422307 RepID=UPI003D6780B9